MGGTSAAITAGILRRRRRAVEAFRSAGATDPLHAKGLSDLGLTRDYVLNGLIAARVIVETQPGRWHLDENAYAAWDSRRLRRGRWVLAVSALLFTLIVIIALV